MPLFSGLNTPTLPSGPYGPVVLTVFLPLISGSPPCSMVGAGVVDPARYLKWHVCDTCLDNRIIGHARDIAQVFNSILCCRVHI
jgi:hypothetical protein